MQPSGPLLDLHLGSPAMTLEEKSLIVRGENQS
jgi:hypothetical protein